eukprot:TRINITY_DN13694_c0_g1_i1.p1 TRINITY_DN13694_c0_g1~~TRINITY_DN13694_c0_g1_i1.p1  ORF type:complete len:139 (+),score=38.93 TRINITY_DN13694_c0_g1_i1:2-418(+)
MLQEKNSKQWYQRRVRDECLNEHWFLNLKHAQEIIEKWLTEYNAERPHSSLGDMIPHEFVKEHAAMLQEKNSKQWYQRRVRDECLNEHWFLNLKHAQEIIEKWLTEYNAERPHSSLGDMIPHEFVKEHAAMLQEKNSI